MASTTFWSQLLKTAFTVKKVASRGQDESLVRKLGRWDLTLLGIGASIGAGIFVLTGIAAKQAGPAVSFSFLIAAAMCVLNALAYAELSSRFPESGSAYLYAYLFDCLLACSRAYLLRYLLACLLIHFLAYLLTDILTSFACLLACLLAHFQPAYLLTHLLAHLRPTYLFTSY